MDPLRRSDPLTRSSKLMKLRISSVLCTFALCAPSAAAWADGETGSAPAAAPAPDATSEDAAPGNAAGAKPAQATVPSLAKVMQLARDKAPIVAVARANVEVSKTAFVGARLGPLT